MLHKAYSVLWFVRYNIDDGATVRKKSTMYLGSSAGSTHLGINHQNMPSKAMTKKGRQDKMLGACRPLKSLGML